jgi:hypothetical protein
MEPIGMILNGWTYWQRRRRGRFCGNPGIQNETGLSKKLGSLIL